MKIVEFRAENFKRLKLVEFRPDESLQIIGGENAQGKTSVLDAVFSALAGASASRQVAEPIRMGEDHAEVTLTFEQFIVTRTWKDGKSSLVIKSPLGAEFKSPQKMLDDLLGRLSFDPLDFTRLQAKQQVNALLDMVSIDIDLEALYETRKGLFEARTDIGRARDEYAGALTSLGEREEAPEELLSITDLVVEGQRLSANNNLRIERERRVEELRDIILKATEELESVKKLLDAQEPLTDLTYINDQVANAEKINDTVRRNIERNRLLTAWEEKKSAYESKTAEIDALDESKKVALANAVFPIEGLGFTDEAVTYNGVPFDQCSSAEQIKVSLAMAMALNPTIRVIFIRDGSLLDKSFMAEIKMMAHEKGYQIWVERVGDMDEAAIIMEDGEVRI